MTRQNPTPEELDSLGRRDSLSFGITHIDLLENKQWEVANRAWMPEIYEQVNPWQLEQNPMGLPRQMTIQKSTQCGMSTMGLVKLFHFAKYWPIRAIYMLPRQQDYIDFVTTRVDPVIQNSSNLSALLGMPDSTRAKRLGNSYLFFMESTVTPRMMPADAVFFDEVDLSDMSNVAIAVHRMDDSDWQLRYNFSTPTVPGYGINGMFEASDKRVWMVQCETCNMWQPLDWDKQLRVLGNRRAPTGVYFGCIKCDTPLTLPVIQQGQWVAEFPERSAKHVGFQISQMMTHDPLWLYEHFIDPNTKIHEFYRFRLGIPYELGIGSLDRDDILVNCFDEPFELETEYDGVSRYYMGVDQGNELQVLVGKFDGRDSRGKVVHVEQVPYTEGGFSRISALMRIFRVSRCVVDADPNRHSARDLQKEFPGKILIADYAETKTEWETKLDPQTGVRTNVVIGRSEGFDALTGGIKDGEWLLPGFPPNFDPDVELVIDHVTAIRRDIENRNTPSGKRDVAVWKELRPSHLAHAWVYLRTARAVDVGKGGRVAVIGEKPKEVIKIGSIDTVVVGLLAEVPLAQLLEYMESRSAAQMPLRYKLSMVHEVTTDQEVIDAAVNFLIADKKLTLDIS